MADEHKLIIAIDPGQTTGVAVMRLTPSEFILEETHQWGDPDTVVNPLLDLINYWSAGYEVTVICESFELRPDVINPDDTPKYIIKDIERTIEPIHPVRYQMASQAKVGAGPGKSGRRDRLKAFGLYQTGNRHANDAIRHIVVYAIEKLRYRPLIVAGWGAPRKKS